MEEPSVTRARGYPINIVSNIMLKLPVKSLLRYRCVSKVLCNIIDSPSFANNHHLEKPSFMRANKYPILAFPRHQTHCISYLAYGLYCLHKDDKSGGNAFLYNHIRGEVMILPQASQVACSTTGYGLGFDASTDTYKLVRHLEFAIFEKLVTEVFTLGTRSWRQISSGGPPCHLSSPGISAHGDIHWEKGMNWTDTNDDEHSSSLIISFDSRKEEFNWTPRPYVMEDYQKSYMVNVRGSLAIIGVLSPTDFEIWVMKDYDTKRWAREYRISNEEWQTSPGCGSLVSLKNYGHVVDEELVVPAFSCVLYTAGLVYILP